MHVGESLDYVLEVDCCHRNFKIWNLVEIVKQSTTIHVFHNQIDEVLIFKHPEELDNIWMVKRSMQSYLLHKLLHHLVLDHLLFLNSFYSRQKTRFVVPRKKDLSELALPQRATKLESVYYLGSLIILRIFCKFLLVLNLYDFVQRLKFLIVRLRRTFAHGRGLGNFRNGSVFDRSATCPMHLKSYMLRRRTGGTYV
jgi:hypothetical protein